MVHHAAPDAVMRAIQAAATQQSLATLKVSQERSWPDSRPRLNHGRAVPRFRVEERLRYHTTLALLLQPIVADRRAAASASSGVAWLASIASA